MKRIIDSFYTLMIQHVSLNTLSLLLVFHITLIYLFFENKIWYNTVIKPNKNSVQIIVGPKVEFVCNELKKLV